MRRMVYIARFGDKNEFKDRYKAAKAIREFSGLSNRLSRYVDYGSNYVLYCSWWWQMEAAPQQRVDYIINNASYDEVVFVCKNKQFVGVIR